MEDLYSHFNTGRIYEGDRASFEMMDEAMGTAYISVNYLDDKDAIYIDKYYENEMLNDEYAQNDIVPFSIDNYHQMLTTVISVMEKMK
jgi:hypothetical protein